MSLEISNILDGWRNFMDKTEVKEKLALQRAKKCLNCTHNKKGILTAFIKDSIKEVEGNYCNLCKCPLSAKIRSINEKCPINEW